MFIHDLTEGRDKTWEEKDSNEQLWPRLLSPAVPTARIRVYGYDASWVKDLGSILDLKELKQHAETLLQHLAHPNEDRNARTHVRPIVIVAHGFGGLMYEQVCPGAPSNSTWVNLENISGCCTVSPAGRR